MHPQIWPHLHKSQHTRKDKCRPADAYNTCEDHHTHCCTRALISCNRSANTEWKTAKDFCCLLTPQIHIQRNGHAQRNRFPWQSFKCNVAPVTRRWSSLFSCTDPITKNTSQHQPQAPPHVSLFGCNLLNHRKSIETSGANLDHLMSIWPWPLPSTHTHTPLNDYLN